MNWITRINTRITQGIAWLVPVLVLELVYDTAARYLFNAPTSWSYDISYMVYGVLFMMGAAHTLHVDKHVRIELFYDRLSARGKAIIDGLGYLIFFFPAMAILIYYGSLFAYKSWQLGETSGASMWQPPIYPFKAVLPLAAVLLLLQGMVEFARCLQTLLGSKDAERKS